MRADPATSLNLNYLLKAFLQILPHSELLGVRIATCILGHSAQLVPEVTVRQDTSSTLSFTCPFCFVITSLNLWLGQDEVSHLPSVGGSRCQNSPHVGLYLFNRLEDLEHASNLGQNGCVKEN